MLLLLVVVMVRLRGSVRTADAVNCSPTTKRWLLLLLLLLLHVLLLHVMLRVEAREGFGVPVLLPQPARLVSVFDLCLEHGLHQSTPAVIALHALEGALDVRAQARRPLRLAARARRGVLRCCGLRCCSGRGRWYRRHGRSVRLHDRLVCLEAKGLRLLLRLRLRLGCGLGRGLDLLLLLRRRLLHQWQLLVGRVVERRVRVLGGKARVHVRLVLLLRVGMNTRRVRRRALIRHLPRRWVRLLRVLRCLVLLRVYPLPPLVVPCRLGRRLGRRPEWLLHELRWRLARVGTDGWHGRTSGGLVWPPLPFPSWALCGIPLVLAVRVHHRSGRGLRRHRRPRRLPRPSLSLCVALSLSRAHTTQSHAHAHALARTSCLARGRWCRHWRRLAHPLGCLGPRRRNTRTVPALGGGGAAAAAGARSRSRGAAGRGAKARAAAPALAPLPRAPRKGEGGGRGKGRARPRRVWPPSAASAP